MGEKKLFCYDSLLSFFLYSPFTWWKKLKLELGFFGSGGFGSGSPTCRGLLGKAGGGTALTSDESSSPMLLCCDDDWKLVDLGTVAGAGADDAGADDGVGAESVGILVRARTSISNPKLTYSGMGMFSSGRPGGTTNLGE